MTTLNTTCRTCRHRRFDSKASEPGWYAIECGNPASPHYRSLLNIDINGNQQSRVTWSGCDRHKPGPARLRGVIRTYRED